MQAFLSLFDGGWSGPDSGAPGYAGVQSADWPDDIFWKPDGAGPGGEDLFRREFGFPPSPGLLAVRWSVHIGRARHALAIVLRQSRGAQPGVGGITADLAARTCR